MKSFEQLGRSAHAAWAKSAQARLNTQVTPWESLRPEIRQEWIDIAMAVAAEIATVL